MWVFNRLREEWRRLVATHVPPAAEEPGPGPAVEPEEVEPPADDVALRSTAMRDPYWTDNLSRIERQRAEQEIRKERAAADQRIRQRTAAWLLGSGTVLLFLIAGVPITKAVQGQPVMSLGVWTLLLLLVLAACVVVGIFFLIARLLSDGSTASEDREVSDAAVSSDLQRFPGQRTAPAGSPTPEADAPDSETGR